MRRLLAFLPIAVGGFLWSGAGVFPLLALGFLSGVLWVTVRG